MEVPKGDAPQEQAPQSEPQQELKAELDEVPEEEALYQVLEQ
jgi:hypothetical protein